MKSKFITLIKKIIFTFLLIFLVTLTVNAQTTITSWNFEPFTGADTNPTPNIGAGSSSVVNLGGGTIGSPGPWQATGMAGTGCGTQNGTPLGAWALNTFTPGSFNESNGVQFNVSTLTYQNIMLTWDQRFSNTSPNTVRLQYTIDGSTWTNFIMTSANTTLCDGSINANGCFENNVGEVYRRVSVDLSGINTINNNPNFRVRLVAAHYQSTGEFRQSVNPLLVAGTNGTWRFDNITFSGTTLTNPNPSVLSGTTSLCAGNSANIRVTITGGVSPYTLVYTDGTSNFTVNNYISASNIPVSPASTTTYSIVSVTDASSNLGTGNSGSAVITVNPLPIVTFTTQPGATACQNTDITYTTQAGQSNYVWTFSGTLATDYTITSGGTTTSNTVVVRWLTTSGGKTLSVNYTNSGGCTAASATISTATTIAALPATPTFIAVTVAANANVCAGNNVTYTTQTSRFNYAWTFTGIAGIDYTIVSGGTINNNFVTLQWLTSGSKIVTVNYSNQATPNCGALVSATRTVNVNISPVITVQNSTAAQTTCIGTPFTPITVTATGTNLTYQWWSNTTYSPVSPPTGGAPTGVTTSTYTPPSAVAGTRYYYVIVSNLGCTSVRSTNYTLAYTVNPISVGGSIAGSASVCAGTNSTSLTLSGHTGSITQWQSSPVSDFSSSVTDIANTTANLTVTNLMTTTYFRAVVASGVCAPVFSTVATITVSPISVGGSITGPTSVCSTTNSSTLTLSGHVGTIVQWQSSPVSDFSSGVTDIANATTTLTITNLTTTTYYRAVVQSSPCSIAYSLTAQLTYKTTTWDGTAWDNGAPDLTTRAIFSSTYTSDGAGSGDLNACSLHVLSGAVVTVTSGDSFTVMNEIHVDSTTLPATLIVEDSSNLIQVNPVVNTDYIYYRRNSMPVKKFDYTYWSSPVSGQVLSAFSPNSSLIYLWNTPTYGWSYVPPATTMSEAKGYIIRTPDIAPFNTVTANVWNGEFFGIPHNGTITTPIVLSGLDDMNLIGNPYPSAVDADSFLTYNRPLNGGVLAGTLFFWTHNTPITANNYSYDDYASYNLTGGVGTMADSSPCSGCNNSVPNGKIGAGQSFFIQALGTGDATFTNSMRFGVNNQFYRSSTVTTAIEKNRVWLEIFNSTGLYKQILIGYIEGASNDYDIEFDGNSIDAGNSIMLYSLLGTKKLGIQGRGLPFNQNDTIPLGYKSTVAGNFEIKLSNFDGLFSTQDIYLEDTLLGVVHNLKTGTYSFSTPAGTFDTRFKLVYTPSGSLDTSTFSASTLLVYQSNQQVTVNSGIVTMKEIAVYDINGRLLNTYDTKNLSEFKFISSTVNQVLLLKITTSDSRVFYKKIVN